ncbi:MAG: hypothetical protein IKM39_03185 [Clostridia bacterium]|nr:hypothetical protein [Clostridia bacterium]
MNEVEFKNWMGKNSVNRKVQSDIISRIKKIEREIENCDIDEQYRSDKCEALLALFLKKGINDEMKKYPEAKFPVGKYHMSTFRYALKQYVLFCEQNKRNNQ